MTSDEDSNVHQLFPAEEAVTEVELAGPGDFAIPVVGVSQYQPVLAAAVEDPEQRTSVVDATLVLEDSNPYDANAVRVEINGERCGYLSRDNARRYRANLTAVGTPALIVHCKARIVGGFETKEGERAHYGMKLDLLPFAG